MKTINILLTTLLLCIGMASAASINMQAAAGPATSYGNQYIFDYNYEKATAVINYDVIGTNFEGHVDATGLKPGVTYQLKFEGKSSCSTGDEFTTNELIGYAGRWWHNGNQNDAYYETNKENACITGYLVFDWVTADENGNVNEDISVQGSYHVLWCDDQGGNSNADLVTLDTSIEPYNEAQLKCDSPQVCPASSVQGEVERPSVQGLPNGDYQALTITLNEESYHQKCGTWTTAMTGEVSFTVDSEYTPAVCGNGVIEGKEACDDGNTNNHDGCSARCTIEDNYDYLTTPGTDNIIGYVQHPSCAAAEGFTIDLYAQGLATSKPYQLKIEGKPTCKMVSGDEETNERIGLNGRWWCETGCPASCPSWGCNLDEHVQDPNAYYEEHKQDAGFCAVGYALFDCVGSDAKGIIDEEGLLVDEARMTCSNPYKKLALPDGDYEAQFLLGKDFSPWDTVGVQQLSFTIGDCSSSTDVPEFGALAAIGIVALAGLFIYKRRN